MKARVIVSIIIKRNGDYLFGRKDKGIGPYPDTWHNLGGGVDLKKENLEEGAKREVKEEAGIEIKNLKRLLFDEDYEPDKKGTKTHFLFLVFEAEYKSGELKAGDDIRELRWFKKKELKNIPLTRPTIKLFKELGII